MTADCIVRDRLQHITLLREHYEDTDHEIFPDNPDLYDWKFGEDGSGECDMLEISGVPCVLRRGSYVMYLGRAAHTVPPQDALFDYGTGQTTEYHPDGGSHHSDATDDGELAADTPHAVAPPTGQDVWIMKVDDVVSIQRQDGLWCTHMVGTTFVTRSYMVHEYAQTVLDRLPVLERLHPRQHIKTDLWDTARGHNLVSDADLWSLAPGATILPPPVGAITSFRVWVYPGCILYLADDTRKKHKQGAVFRGDDPHSRCVCVKCRQEYLPASDIMAYCSICGDMPLKRAWCHESCAVSAPTPARLTALRVEIPLAQDEDDVEAPPIRRAPSHGPPVWLLAPRGIRIRVDCPVRTWERPSVAVRRAGLRQGPYDNLEQFMNVVASLTAQTDEPFQREMPQVEVQGALQLETDEDDAFRLLYCPTCHAVM